MKPDFACAVDSVYFQGNCKITDLKSPLQRGEAGVISLTVAFICISPQTQTS